MHDNDPKHVRKICQNYLQFWQLEENSNVKIMEWPDLPTWIPWKNYGITWTDKAETDVQSQKNIYGLFYTRNLIDSEVIKETNSPNASTLKRGYKILTRRRYNYSFIIIWIIG